MAAPSALAQATPSDLPDAAPQAGQTAQVARTSQISQISPVAAARTDALPQHEQPHIGSLSIRGFYRTEDLVWNINGGAINIISELTWDDVESSGLEAAARIPLPGNLEFRGSAAYGRIVGGEIQDSDYNGSNRTLEFSRSISQTDRGSVWDLSAALGWNQPLGARFAITPFIGLSYNRQNYNIRDGVQIVPALGPSVLAGLDSDYEGEWLGFFWGAELRHRLTEICELRASFSAHSMNYHADGYFNLRTDLGDPSFSHDTVAQGSTFRGEAIFELGRGWTLELIASLRDWESDSGRTKFRLASGGVSRQRFNEIEVDTRMLSLGLVYTY